MRRRPAVLLLLAARGGAGGPGLGAHQPGDHVESLRVTLDGGDLTALEGHRDLAWSARLGLNAGDAFRTTGTLGTDVD
ncbi:hypothetical protein [Streptomyces scopuliridis]|uniref:hypothetical protein n=1 Tax=Streptomyces scopuliridis TaxID=452529 RepID=UPI0036C029A9